MSAATAPVRHLAVRAPNWVGDLVMATPVLVAAAADERFERVTILVREHLVPVLSGGALAPLVATLLRRADEARLLRALRPDALLLLTNSFAAAARAWAARVPLRAGANLSGRRWLLTHSFTPPTRDGRRAPIPTGHLLRDAAGLLGIEVPSLHPVLSISAAAHERARRGLASAGLRAGEPYVLCCPGAAFGAAKLWPPESFAAVLDGLHARHGWRGFVSGGPGEEPLCAAVASASRSGVRSLCDQERDLDVLKGYVAGARLLLVGDSGPRWYAAAFDVPCVSVMGPNFPELTSSSLELCEVVRLEGLECSPCLERVCPLGHHRCMRDLEPDLVLEAAERVLTRRAEAPLAPA